MNFDKYIRNAKESKFGLWKLNMGLFYMIPFNKPHGIKIKSIKDNEVTTVIPLKRKNFNHIKGIHACGMATCSEFASGFLLMTKLGAKNFRIIMESLEMKYHYQAKTEIVAEFSVNDDWMDKYIFDPLKSEESVLVKCQIELYESERNHVATGYTNWQIKPWDKVRTKV